LQSILSGALKQSAIITGKGDENLPSLMAGLADECLPKYFYNMAHTNLFGISKARCLAMGACSQLINRLAKQKDRKV